jgi:hypothetical protein
MKNLFSVQKKFNQKLYGDNLSDKEKAEITKTLSLCLHSEVSELMQSVTFKDHHIQTDNIDKVKMLFESVDVVRYVIAILNLNDIDADEFIRAYDDKDVYLNNLDKDQKSWDGKQKVVIVDIDDVISEFRAHFAKHLNEEYDLYPDVESEEYYFITALSKLDMNPEQVFEKFTDQGGFRDIPVVEGAIEMLQSIRNRGYWIQLLTARPKENLKCFHDTYYWLDKHNIPYDAIDFSSEKFRWCAKSKYYDAGKIEFAIDDAPKNVSDYAKHGIFCYMPKKNYNKEVRNMNKTSTYPHPKDLFQGCF